jgi:hypothetical protein
MVRGSNPSGVKIFRTPPSWLWGPLSLLYNGYQVSFPGLRWPGCDINHPPPSSTEVKEREHLYLHSPCGPSWDEFTFFKENFICQIFQHDINISADSMLIDTDCSYKTPHTAFTPGPRKRVKTNTSTESVIPISGNISREKISSTGK